MNGGGHVGILVAGASIDSTYRNQEANVKRLPSMDNFIELMALEDIVKKVKDKLKASNFEELYTNLHNDNPNSYEITETEKRVSDYFGEMPLLNEPTIYDYLILSLRSKDIIAKFNWDPFLYQAFVRNHNVGESLNPFFSVDSPTRVSRTPCNCPVVFCKKQCCVVSATPMKQQQIGIRDILLFDTTLKKELENITLQKENIKLQLTTKFHPLRATSDPFAVFMRPMYACKSA